MKRRVLDTLDMWRRHMAAMVTIGGPDGPLDPGLPVAHLPW